VYMRTCSLLAARPKGHLHPLPPRLQEPRNVQHAVPVQPWLQSSASLVIIGSCQRVPCSLSPLFLKRRPIPAVWMIWTNIFHLSQRGYDTRICITTILQLFYSFAGSRWDAFDTKYPWTSAARIQTIVCSYVLWEW
jgi:hypothetical protein